ncbi:hypothetical protein [Bradyrhizobium uaiense]|uniref:Uncharacterized protein n=1 Tax=Bradyrhizobium uaiense TaxID=2594946 RepID=A0A6P1BFE5_9BRAD|nr:hypothetical protein [Bradyrhizobium uaiense]NEU96331.1 hypothetical protein [Bradyrhizobium uaiense]
MAITGDFFDRIQDKATFLEEVHLDFYTRSEEMGALPHWNKAKALDAYFQWKQDLERIQLVEKNVKTPDHIKCAAHLIYWLRRYSPVNDFAFDGPTDEAREFLLKYGREYLAFDLGYRAAQFYECKIFGRDLPEETSFSLDSKLPGVGRNDFINSVTHVLKLKMVSPHALTILLKAVFLRP